ncbi:MAG: hypothetical protein WCP97_01570 [bacterium]
MHKYEKKTPLEYIDDLITIAEEPFDEKSRKLYRAIHVLGHEVNPDRYPLAKKLVESFLTHPHPDIRYISLMVLVLHWNCQDHLETSVRFSQESPIIDPDEFFNPDYQNPRLGVSCIGSLLRGTKNPQYLYYLLSIFRNPPSEDIAYVSYCSILNLLGIPTNNHPSAASVFNVERDTNMQWLKDAEKIAVEWKKQQM